MEGLHYTWILFLLFYFQNVYPKYRRMIYTHIFTFCNSHLPYQILMMDMLHKLSLVISVLFCRITKSIQIYFSEFCAETEIHIRSHQRVNSKTGKNQQKHTVEIENVVRAKNTVASTWNVVRQRFKVIDLHWAIRTNKIFVCDVGLLVLSPKSNKREKFEWDGYLKISFVKMGFHWNLVGVDIWRIS